MGRYINNAEGQANGTVLTVANSGDKSGTPFTTLSGGGSCVFSNTDSVDGVQCYWINEATNQKYVAWDGLSVPKMSGRMYVKYVSMPTNSQDHMSFQNGPKLQIITGTNKMRLVPAAGGVSFDFATALSAGVWHRFDMYAKLGASASTGTILCSHFLGHSTTPIEVYDMTGNGYAGTANYTGMRMMKLTGSVPLNAKFDGLALDTDFEGLLGPTRGTTWRVRKSGLIVRGRPKIYKSAAWDHIIT